MKKIKPLLLFLFILSPLAPLCGCEEYVPLVTENEISQIENEEYDFRYGDVDKYTYETFLLLNKEKEKDTYYQVGSTVFKAPYDFRIIVKNTYTKEYCYLKEAYKSNSYNINQVAYLAFCHRQYIKTFKSELSRDDFNKWYDSNSPKMERSHFSSIDYSIIGKTLYSTSFTVTLKNEESIKGIRYLASDFPDVNYLKSVWHSKTINTANEDDHGNFNIDYNKTFLGISYEYRAQLGFNVGYIKEVDVAKEIVKQIKAYPIVYDVTLNEPIGSSGFII